MALHLTSARSGDSRYDSLVSPFRSLGPFIEADRETLLREESCALEGTVFRLIDKGRYRRGVQIVSLGDLNLIAGRTTPIQSSNHSPNFECFFAMPLMGGFTTRDGALCDEVSAGDLYLNQNYYATSTIGYLSSLFVALDRQRLERTMRSISGGISLSSLDTSIVVRAGGRKHGAVGSSKMWSLLSFIDRLHGEDEVIPQCLGLDEQFYRLLALALLEAVGRLDAVRQHWSRPAGSWVRPLDDLIDYIRANAHASLTLTDLEERSHYSARRLQMLFRERFDCTPMQFVRRQRLEAAMEKLQTADDDDTVTSIARSCGYRFTANFTTDFKNQFGINPSMVLRASRGGAPSVRLSR